MAIEKYDLTSMTTTLHLQKKTKKTGRVNFSNLSTLAVIAFALSMFIFPEVKATMIRGLMAIGLFQPDIANSKDLTAFPAEDVTFADIKGKRISLASLKNKVVFINFWATWCPPCRAEMPAINKLYTRFKSNKNVVFLLVDADGKPELSNAFMKSQGYDLPVYTMAGAVPESLFAGSLPTTVILDKSGHIAYSGIGAADYSNPKIAAFIDGLLK